MQKLIDVVYSYCSKWRLRANVSKSAVMVFSKDAVNGCWKWEKYSFPVVSSYSYLGIDFSSNGAWDVYRQTIGIPMGTDCVPQLANLFLFHYEYLYMKNLMHDNLCMAKRFSDTVRYIDDLLTLNNSNFEEEIPNIYPPELRATSESDTKLSYLDISSSICSSKNVTEVYDKRDL